MISTCCSSGETGQDSLGEASDINMQQGLVALDPWYVTNGGHARVAGIKNLCICHV